MRDQASPLRNLVLRESAVSADGPRSRTIVVAGGKSGLGVTTVGVNLAVAFSRHGLRTVLIDADLENSDAATLCGCAPTPGLGEVLASRRDIHEVLQRGPGGIQLVSGVGKEELRTHVAPRLQVAPALQGTPKARSSPKSPCTPKAQQRFLRQLNSLSKHVDVVVVDAGNASTDLARQLWATAHDVLLVTSPDVVAVMDSYASVKTMYVPGAGPHVRLLVNQAGNQAEAADVFRRIDQSCQRFLGVALDFAGTVPSDDQALQAARHGVPIMLLAPHSALSRAVDQLADLLVSTEANDEHELRRAA